MAEFSSNDINEAKRRVREMQNKVRSYQKAETSRYEQREEDKKPDENSSAPSSDLGLFNILGDLTGGEDSSKGLILALILVLAREKADNMLILALLYILL